MTAPNEPGLRPAPAAPAPADPGDYEDIIREGATMALYVAVCLLAAFGVLPAHDESVHAEAYPVVWGTTLGLALAHVFAFTMSSRISARGRLARHDIEAMGAQLVGAAGVAASVSVPILLLPVSSEFDAARYLLAALIAALGFGVANRRGASLRRSVLFAFVVLVLAVTVAALKAMLAGH